jgi:hypothetical protein
MSSTRASSVGADGELHAIVVERWTRSEHKGLRQFPALEEPELDEHPIRFRSFAHPREMSRRS